jgi:glycosyltransferase involved in cell wall biosynthesis
MKILLATIFYPPTHIGGTEVYTHALAKNLQRLGHTVRVVCAENWGQGESAWNGYRDEVYEGIPIRRLYLNWTKMAKVNRSLYDNPVVAAFFQKFLTEWQPEVVHVTSCQTLSASTIAVAKRAGAAVVVTLLDFWFLCPRVTLRRGDGTLCSGRVKAWECLECLLYATKIERGSNALLPEPLRHAFLTRLSQQNGLTGMRGLRGMAMDIEDRRRVLREALMQADYIISPSSFVKRAFAENDLNVPIDVIPMGNELSWLTAYTGKLPSPVIRFGYLGQILAIKGIHHIIQAFRSLRGKSDAELYIHGALDKDPSYTEQLYQWSNGDARIHFAGPYQRGEIARVLANLDVVVFASVWHETYGLVIQEAFATRTPVLASNVGAVPENVRDEVNGLLFQAGNVQDLARQMQRVMDEPNVLARLQAGIQPVKTIEREARELEQIYKSVLNPLQRQQNFDHSAFEQERETRHHRIELDA